MSKRPYFHGLSLILMSLMVSACFENASFESFCVADSAQSESNGACSSVFQATFMEDSFERDDIFLVDNDTSFDFGWRAIIDDMGRVVSGASSNNVEVRIYNDQDMGVAADGSSAVYFRGRQGSSVHNLYLISKSFDLSDYAGGNIQFDYLAVDLEPGEYIKFEVCAGTVEECGVGESFDLDGLNGPHWVSLYEAGPESDGNGLNGQNHDLGHWKRAQVEFFLENYPAASEFTFRFNVRMDEGFIGNDIANGMEDGLAIDRILGVVSTPLQ